MHPLGQESAYPLIGPLTRPNVPEGRENRAAVTIFPDGHIGPLSCAYARHLVTYGSRPNHRNLTFGLAVGGSVVGRPAAVDGYALLSHDGRRRFRQLRARRVHARRFGLWASQFTNAAGEDIRYVARDEANDAGLPNHDYWLFDSRKLARMHFGEDNRFLGAEIVEDPAVIVEHNYWRDAAWHCAVRRDDFGTEQG
jgi:Family of unknown function (DUF6879)